MAYKVMKREFYKHRPKWLVRFLMTLPDEIYLVKGSLQQAQASLQNIVDIIDYTDLMAEKFRCCLYVDNDHVIITSEKHNPLVGFYIDKDFQDESQEHQ